MSEIQEELDSQVAPTEAVKLFKNTTERERVFAQLKVMGIATMELSFSGSGDDGNIDELVAYDHAGQVMEYRGKTLAMPVKSIVFNRRVRSPAPGGLRESVVAGDWEIVHGMQQIPIKTAFENLFWTIDGRADIDWVNNDGGQGEMMVDVDAGTIEVNYHVNETVSTDAGTWAAV